MSFSNSPREATYSCTALMGTNKKGLIKPDGDGYYELVVGALDAYNSSGAFYPLGPAKQLFESSSEFMRRVANGDCKGECGHPKPQPGATFRDFLQRIMTIEETNVCCHFKSFTLKPMKDQTGKDVIGIVAKLKPSGPKGQYLKEALENPNEGVNFSIRSLTQDQMMPSGITQKSIKTIICFDWVTEPGLSACRKWFSPSLEAMNDSVFNEKQLDAVIEKRTKMAVGMESNSFLDQIKKDLGWDKPNYKVPASSQW